MKNLLIIAALFLTACGGNAANTANNNTSANSGTANSTNTASGSNSAVNANTNANANANKPADNSPKRISFNKGANWGAVNITLAPGASQKLIVGAKSGQSMNVEASSKEVSINLTKGKAETTEDFGFLSAELQANGDYVFEVKNSTKKEVKTSVKVTIEGGDPKSEQNDSDFVPVDDDDEPIQSNRKDN